MAKIDEFRTKIGEIDAETTRVANKIDELVGKLAAGGMTDEEEQEVFNALGAVSSRLKAIGTDPDNPVPPVEG